MTGSPVMRGAKLREARLREARLRQAILRESMQPQMPRKYRSKHRT
ncbi:MAG: pentapeptide repeat-containing protein [Pseudomonadales bacterium]|nr:pentapeptide repeat-containing protein [Pseudomonadales bacterium]